MKLFLSTLSIVVALSLMASQSPKRKVTISLPSVPGDTNVYTTTVYLSDKSPTLTAVAKTNVTLYWSAPVGESLTNYAFQVWHTTNVFAKFHYGNEASMTNVLDRWTLLTNVVGVTNVILPMKFNYEWFALTSFRINKY